MLVDGIRTTSYPLRQQQPAAPSQTHLFVRFFVAKILELLELIEFAVHSTLKGKRGLDTRQKLFGVDLSGVVLLYRPDAALQFVTLGESVCS